MEDVLRLKGKILPDTPKYIEAKKYLDATREYITPVSLSDKPLTKEYLYELNINNPETYKKLKSAYDIYIANALKKGAEEKENVIKKMYTSF